MTARFVWTLTWGDDALRAACMDLSAGIIGAARLVLAETREQRDFTRRAYASVLLGSIAADSSVAEMWVKDESRNPDALLLLARVVVHRTLCIANPRGPYEARVLRLIGRAERACLASAERWSEDPTPWVTLLSLDHLRLRRPVMPSDTLTIGPLPGPWDLVEGEIWPRDRFHREAGHRLLTYFSPHSGGSNAELNEFVTWAHQTSPAVSPLRLLPLAAELEHVENIEADVQDEIARHRRIETLRRCIAEAEQGLELFHTDEQAEAKIPVYEQDLRSHRDRLKRELTAAEQAEAQPTRSTSRSFLHNAAMDLYREWFLNVREPQPVKLPRSLPLSDLMLLAYTLHKLGETLAAGNILSFTKPYATPSPWTKDGNPSDVLARAYTTCQVPLPP